MKNLFTFITKLAIASAFVFVCSATFASAATYYLAPTGSDSNACTLSAPCFTLERAWQLISAGDTVYMRGGTYAYNDMQYYFSLNAATYILALLCVLNLIIWVWYMKSLRKKDSKKSKPKKK